MSISTSPDTQWQQIIVAVQKELFCLSEDERRWIEQHLANIGELQRQLHQLFVQANGPEHCQKCLGSCCELGNNHMTLVNVLSGLLQHNLPGADFSRTCPFLGDIGCTLQVETRPFNCVTFICDIIEDTLTTQDQERFYLLERQLREQYTAFDQRYIGSSLQGILIRSQSMSGNRFLAHRN